MVENIFKKYRIFENVMFYRVQSEYGTQCFIVIQHDNYSQYGFFLAVSKIITVLMFEIKFDKSHAMGICGSLNLRLSQYRSF